MKLIDEWRTAINKLWSVRLALFTALLGLADTMLHQYGEALPPLVYAGMSVAIIVSRLVQQA